MTTQFVQAIPPKWRPVGRIILWAGCAFLVLSFLLWRWLVSPQRAMKVFYGRQPENSFRIVAEETLMDPLIVSGDRVVPLILQEIRNRSMERRVYAIGFLGYGKYVEAIPDLVLILMDGQDSEHARGSALRAIHRISPRLGRRLAAEYSERSDSLGVSAARIVEGDPALLERRGRWDALLNSVF